MSTPSEVSAEIDVTSNDGLLNNGGHNILQTSIKWRVPSKGFSS